MMAFLDEPNSCLCGCGGLTSGPKKRFIQGHDAKLAKKWKEMRLGRLDKSEIPKEVWELVKADELLVIKKVEKQIEKEQKTRPKGDDENSNKINIDDIIKKLEQHLTK